MMTKLEMTKTEFVNEYMHICMTYGMAVVLMRRALTDEPLRTLE